MKIAFTSNGIEWDSLIDPRFGRTKYLLSFDDEKGELFHHDNTSVEEMAHGAGPETARKLFELHPDILITGNGPGENAATILEKADIKIFIGAGDKTVKEALDAFKKGELVEI